MSDEVIPQLPWHVAAYTKMADTGDYNIEISNGTSSKWFTIKAGELKERGVRQVGIGDLWNP